MADPARAPGSLMRKAWLIFTLATIVSSLAVLTIYVTAYDDNGLTDRLRAIGRFTRLAMRVTSFPLGLPLGAAANGPLEQHFGCAEPNEPCAVFIDWWTHFAAVLVQISLLRWFVRRSS